MNLWNNFCKPSLEENFSLIFVGNIILSKRLHYARILFMFFSSTTTGRGFSLIVGWTFFLRDLNIYEYSIFFVLFLLLGEFNSQSQ